MGKVTQGWALTHQVFAIKYAAFIQMLEEKSRDDRSSNMLSKIINRLKLLIIKLI